MSTDDPAEPADPEERAAELERRRQDLDLERRQLELDAQRLELERHRRDLEAQTRPSQQPVPPPNPGYGPGPHGTAQPTIAMTSPPTVLGEDEAGRGPWRLAAIAAALVLLAGAAAAWFLLGSRNGDTANEVAAVDDTGDVAVLTGEGNEAEDTPAFIGEPSPDPTPIADGSLGSGGPIGPCMIPATDAYTDVGLAVPRLEGLTPSVGTVTIAVIFVDFDDAPATQSTQDVQALFDPLIPDFYAELSYGRAQLVFEPHLDQWFRMSQPSAFYGQSLTDGLLHENWIREAMTVADPTVDFSRADAVLVVANPDAEAIPYGPVANRAIPEFAFSADGVTIPSGITSGYDLNFWGGLWLAHEVGHTMSLPDLYAHEPEGDAPEDGLRYTGVWSIMADIAGAGPGMFAIERWMLGWLDDTQIACHAGGAGRYEITPLETPGGPKAVMVPLSETAVLVVESRRAIGADTLIEKEGALVYVADSGVQSGFGPIDVSPGVDTGPLKERSPLAPGETYTYGDVTVTVVEAGADGDIVEVSVG